MSVSVSATRPTLGNPSWRRRINRLLSVLVVVAVMVLCGALAHRWSEQRAVDALRQEANHKLDLFAAVAQGVVRRLEHVPATVQLNPEVLALLRAPEDARLVRQVNAYLRRLNGHVGSLLVYVIDERGIVRASSDADLAADSLIGRDLAFRPYFLDALSGRVGRHFAIGVMRDEPGYFVSHPIYDGAHVVGVAAIKISLAPIEETWPMLAAPALVADSHGVVVLSSQPEWRYTALQALSQEERVDLQLARTYATLSIPPFPLALPRGLPGETSELESRFDTVMPGGRGPRRESTLVLGRTLDGMDWRVITLASLRSAQTQALTHGLLAGLAAGFVGLLALLVQQRRRIVRQKLEAQRLLEQANVQLEHQVARRTADLSSTNEQLLQEVREREQAEATLRAAQDELIHAAKMAALGQLATGITHELSQPLGGIRTLSGNALEFLRRGQLPVVEHNLDLVTRLADQMGQIIDPLKGFARKSAPHAQAVDLGQAVRGALFLFDLRLRKEAIRLVEEPTSQPVQGWCDANRLQQVLVNLVGNALDAMQQAAAPALTLAWGCNGQAPDGSSLEGWCWVRVQDNGPGLTPEQRQRLFEPFFTTKAVGSGLGLGLAISRDIVREFGGEIQADNLPGGGACFLVRIPPVPAPADDVRH